MTHRLLRSLEKRVQRRLGKGYGASSIRDEVNAIRRLLNGEVRQCVDIGGNIGNYTATLLDVFPSAQVTAFEPASTNVQALRTRFDDDARVTIVPCAVSNTAGGATLYSDTPGSGLGSLTKRDLDFMNISFDTAETVETIRFEEYWTRVMGAPTIDILKLDIEGHELDALTGAGEAMSHVRAVQFEFGGCNIDTRTFFKDFWTFFTDRGFALYRITPAGSLPMERYSERDEAFVTTNYIAIAKGQTR